jgi:hypothetical protein
MYGGAIGYVLETDGTGNLSWTSKGTILTNIIDLTPDTSNTLGILANVIVMTVANTTPYTNGTAVTITGVQGNSNANINSSILYVKLADDFPTSGNTILFETQNLANANAFALGTLTYTNSPDAVATTSLGTSGTANAYGSDGTVQYSSGGILTGSANFSYDNVTSTLNVTGIINGSDINSSGNITASRLVSNMATGTAPITVSSTTRVANLNVSHANVSDFGVVTTQTTGTFYPVFVSANTSANYALGSNASFRYNAATGNLIATLLTGTLTTAAQPNVTSVGSLTTLTVTGNITGGNLTTAGRVSATGNANVGNLGTSGLIVATGNITGGNLTTGGVVVATGNITGGNLTTAGIVTASRLISNVATGTAPLTVTSTTRVANLNVNYANVADFISVAAGTGNNFLIFANAATGNVSELTSTGLTANLSNNSITATTFVGALSGAATSATTAGTVTTAAQPNITSTGTLSSVTVTANVTTGGIKTDNYYYANGVSISFAGSYSNSNVASYLPTFTGTVGATTLTTGANTTAGTITGNWTLSAGSRLNATYADLAEYYEADTEYEPGTVLAFGGEKEVTIAEDGTTRVAGVVSTNPAYVMNATCQGIAVAIALQGRVPTKIRGTVRKGDMMVSAGNGYARPWNNPHMGTVIGKALEDFDGVEGIIEVAVGRL